MSLYNEGINKMSGFNAKSLSQMSKLKMLKSWKTKPRAWVINLRCVKKRKHCQELPAGQIMNAVW